MSKFKLTLTLPKVNQDWWKSSKRELNELVENYNRDNWPKQRDPVTLKPWAPRKAPTGTWPVLRKTGEMQDTTKFKVGKTPMDFIAKTVNYGPFHQDGTKKMAQRRWLGIGSTLLDPMAKVIGKNIFKGKNIYRIEAGYENR